MTIYYNDITKPLPIKREEIPNFTRFYQCENCKLTRENSGWRSIRFYVRYNMILCDECVDKKDGTWIYIDEKNK